MGASATVLIQLLAACVTLGRLHNLSELHFPIIKMGMIIMAGVGTYGCRGEVGLQSSWHSYHQATYHGLRQCGPQKRVTILQTTPH